MSLCGIGLEAGLVQCIPRDAWGSAKTGLCLHHRTSLSPSSVPDWSLLPEELLHIISKNLDECFDVVHARSVCTLWRSICLHHYAFIYVCLRFTLLKEALSP
ncbi:hypothetical protein DY000_02006188 [Brassica cretica]|uniref:F-box domain-containing protein n=1 Tax=Brassica cretica TaxID=69181 RepID=A0ABQ7CL65_BRACR|nr:hypothetical protein DY000_02006188 [Brassica cretica]